MHIHDWRDRIPLNPLWGGATIGTSNIRRYVTVHYTDARPIPVERQHGEGLLHQLRIDADWQMRPGWSGTSHGADGLMYHYAVGSDGMIVQCRNEDAILWHCADGVGNAQSLAINLPIGGDQAPTGEMLRGLSDLLLHLCEKYHIPRARVRGHMEWSATGCPGVPTMRWLTGWREALPETEPPREPGAWICRYPATVRTMPSRAGRVVMTLQPGHEVGVVSWVQGEMVPGSDDWWSHWETRLGFIHSSALEREV